MTGRPKGSGGQARVLTAEEVRRIISCIGGTRHELRDRALFSFGVGTGMRISELCSLDVRDVAGPKLRALDEVVLDLRRTKSKKSRTVSVSKQAQDELTHYLQQRFGKRAAEEALALPLWLAQGTKGGRLTVQGATASLTGAFRRAGLTNVSTHSMRRTHANTLRRNGVDLKIIQAQLGHSTLAITERYFTVDPAEAREAIGRLKF